MVYPPDIALIWSFADFWEVVIPFCAFRWFQADPGLFSKRDLLIFLIAGVFLNNFAGAAWGTWALSISGIISQKQIMITFLGWLITNIFVCGLICPVLLKGLTPFLRTHELYQGKIVR